MTSASGVLKSVIKPVYHGLRRLFPGIYYHLRYYQAARQLGNLVREHERSFNQLLEESKGKRCLQIGVKDQYRAKFGPDWVSVDLYDMRDFIDYHYDITDLKFPDGSFDVVVCISILEHVPDPLRAIQELRRVLAPGGKIWVQLPFHYPYHEGPHDFWRVSPEGLRIWMRDFNEILCGSMLWSRTALASSTFYYGRKPSE
jgi:SAM-dependent methyltransferase